MYVCLHLSALACGYSFTSIDPPQRKSSKAQNWCTLTLDRIQAKCENYTHLLSQVKTFVDNMGISSRVNSWSKTSSLQVRDTVDFVYIEF